MKKKSISEIGTPINNADLNKIKGGIIMENLPQYGLLCQTTNSPGMGLVNAENAKNIAEYIGAKPVHEIIKE